MERRKHPRHPITLPVEYWETDDFSHGGLASNISESGMLIYSAKDIPVSRELNIRIFFSDWYKFDGLRVIAKILWKKLQHGTNRKIYEYGVNLFGYLR